MNLQLVILFNLQLVIGVNTQQVITFNPQLVISFNTTRKPWAMVARGIGSSVSNSDVILWKLRVKSNKGPVDEQYSGIV